MATINAFHCPVTHFSRFRECSISNQPPSIVWIRRRNQLNNRIVIRNNAASSAGSSTPESDLNPYEVLGVNPIEGFDMVKAAYTKKRKDAERRGDGATVELLERAYDKLMMAQLMNRKKGVTVGDLKVSKDIKYADKQPLVPWGPRPSKSSEQDIRINLAISAVFTIWVTVQRNCDWMPLQLLGILFVYRIFEKLKASEPQVSPTLMEEGEDGGRGSRMGKRLLRSLSLVFGCIAVAAVGFTAVLNLIEFSGQYIPAFLYNNQELFVTASTAIMLYVISSFYR